MRTLSIFTRWKQGEISKVTETSNIIGVLRTRVAAKFQETFKKALDVRFSGFGIDDDTIEIEANQDKPLRSMTAQRCRQKTGES